MNNQNQIFKRTLILAQFFFIIFIYHVLKDLKDTLVITSSSAGANIIPFIKTWAMLPFAVLASYVFSKLYQRFGREKTLYAFVGGLLAFYAFFAFVLFPHRDALMLEKVASFLDSTLVEGTEGFTAMIQYWFYTAFYLTAELWSMMILTTLFWGYVNSTSTIEDAKSFYPLCALVGNCAGIISGQSSSFLCRYFENHLPWEQILQALILIVIVLGIVVMGISRWLAAYDDADSPVQMKAARPKVSYKESILSILRSKPLLYIATIVVGYALTSNLIEVVWKGSIKAVYPKPQEYNAYVNTLTSTIGVMAVIMALVIRWMFQRLSWSTMALITPVALFSTSILFFLAMHLPTNLLESVSSFVTVTPAYLIMSLGSLYYVLATTAKYTIFDTTKDIAFLTIEQEERMRAKSVIDCVGSRLGKSGASCLYQMLLVVFGATAGQISIIGTACILMISGVILSVYRLGGHVAAPVETADPEEPVAA